MERMIRQIVSAVFLVFTSLPMALAQTTTATLLGTIKDASGSVVPGAALTGSQP